jgi:glucose-6-phosphate isomerase
MTADALKSQAKTDADIKIVDQFAADADRLNRMSLSVCGLYVDVSKQSWTQAGFAAAVAAIDASGIAAAREKMWTGQEINVSEGRAVLHVALRDSDAENRRLRGDEIADDVKSSRDAMKAYADGIQSGTITGSSGKPFKTLIHIGIGGSDLGPRLLFQALSPLSPRIDVRFVANVDGSELALALVGLDPAETLVIAVSKTFGTQETLTNFVAARDWLVKGLGEDAAKKHMAAVSTAADKTAQYGIPHDRVFGFKDWVGGRYSLWSAVSLSIIIALGYDVYQGLLDGAHAMDDHFYTAPLDRNAPVLLAGASPPSCSSWKWNRTASAPARPANLSTSRPARSSSATKAPMPSTPSSRCCTSPTTSCRWNSSPRSRTPNPPTICKRSCCRTSSPRAKPSWSASRWRSPKPNARHSAWTMRRPPRSPRKRFAPATSRRPWC